MKNFKLLDTVRVRQPRSNLFELHPKVAKLRGLVIGKLDRRTYWVQWSNGEDSLIDGKEIESARFDFFPRK